jgi:hypothetical protein
LETEEGEMMENTELTAEEKKDLKEQFTRVHSIVYDLATSYAHWARTTYLEGSDKVRSETKLKKLHEEANEIHTRTFNKTIAEGDEKFAKIKEYIDKLTGELHGKQNESEKQHG